MIYQLSSILFASFDSTLLFLMLLIFKSKILRYVGARWYYYLWFVIFVPWFSVCLPLDFSIANSPHINMAPLVKYIDSFVINFLLRYQYSPVKLIIYFWIVGAAFALCYVSYSYIRLILNLKTESTPLSAGQQKIAESSLKNRNLIPLSRIYITTLLNSPMICHVIKSKIYLPQNFFSNYKAIEKSYVLHHECIHFQRCDLIANFSMIILLCLNWFNPLLVYSYRYFRGAQELSCDALLSQQYPMFDSKAYGYALLKTAVSESSQSLLHCPWNMGSQLKERCIALKFHQANPIKNLIGIILLTISAGVALAAPSLQNHMFFQDLRISNFSNNKFTVVVNYKCEDKLAVIEKNSVTSISQSRIQSLCSKAYWSCAISFHQSGNCSDKEIATVGLDLQGAVTSIKVSGKYNISGKDHNLLFYEHFKP